MSDTNEKHQVTNGEMILRIFENADLKILCPGAVLGSKTCLQDNLDCDVCKITFWASKYQPPHREYALKDNPIFESEAKS